MKMESITGSEVRSRVRVRRKWSISNDIIALELESDSSLPLAQAQPGAHLEVLLPTTVDKPLIRHYSLCNAPTERDAYLLAIKREPQSRGGSAYIHDAMAEGDVLEVSAPRNQFPPVENAGRHVLFAGGIGITPMLSIAQYLKATNSPFQLYYFARSLDHAAFVDRLQDLGPSFHLRLGLSAQETAEVMSAALEDADGSTHVYACGPQPFIAAAEGLATGKLGAARFHCEHFSAAPPANPGGEHAFDVELRKRGAVCRVEADQTIVQALETAGHVVPLSCEQGVCGTCLTRVISGTPDHRDSYLSAAEKAKGDQMLICVSRAASNHIVLDL